jgi:2-keto-4-pentenoate hydratase/2-oxohepta-3-ene-1,7-dioic acid hydratase in catechol pathway
MTVRGTEDRSLRKSVDSYAVLGPYLVTADEVKDPDKLHMVITVNGEKRQDANTDKMIFSTRRLIEYASRFYKLLPGDLIYTGTPPGVGIARDPKVWLKDGDVVEVEIDGLGRVTNPVVDWDVDLSGPGEQLAVSPNTLHVALAIPEDEAERRVAEGRLEP